MKERITIQELSDILTKSLTLPNDRIYTALNEIDRAMAGNLFLLFSKKTLYEELRPILEPEKIMIIQSNIGSEDDISNSDSQEFNEIESFHHFLNLPSQNFTVMLTTETLTQDKIVQYEHLRIISANQFTPPTFKNEIETQVKFEEHLGNSIVEVSNLYCVDERKAFELALEIVCTSLDIFTLHSREMPPRYYILDPDQEPSCTYWVLDETKDLKLKGDCGQRSIKGLGRLDIKNLKSFHKILIPENKIENNLIFRMKRAFRWYRRMENAKKDEEKAIDSVACLEILLLPECLGGRKKEELAKIIALLLSQTMPQHDRIKKIAIKIYKNRNFIVHDGVSHPEENISEHTVRLLIIQCIYRIQKYLETCESIEAVLEKVKQEKRETRSQKLGNLTSRKVEMCKFFKIPSSLTYILNEKTIGNISGTTTLKFVDDCTHCYVEGWFKPDGKFNGAWASDSEAIIETIGTDISWNLRIADIIFHPGSFQTSHMRFMETIKFESGSFEFIK